MYHMKKIIALLLALSLCLLCGCGGDAKQTEAPTTEAAPVTDAPTEAPATEAPTEAPTEAVQVYTNPLTGEVLDAPFTNRLFAVTINNLEDALPHRGVYQADLFLEMYVNHSIIRGLAVFSDIASVESIGSVRSTRPIFTDIAGRYDLFVAHAGGSAQALNDQFKSGIDNMNIDTGDATDYSYRDKERTGAYEHTLFAKGAGLKATVEGKGVRVTQEPGKTYGLTFAEDGTPANGENASSVTISFMYSNVYKDTVMAYNSEVGKYVYHQYGQMMADADTGEMEAFENVIVIIGNDKLDGTGYHIFDFNGGGEGYFACGGQIIPIKWSCAGDDQPLTFTTMDGEPIALGVGSTYIAIAPIGSKVAYE